MRMLSLSALGHSQRVDDVAFYYSSLRMSAAIQEGVQVAKQTNPHHHHIKTMGRQVCDIK